MTSLWLKGTGRGGNADRDLHSGTTPAAAQGQGSQEERPRRSAVGTQPSPGTRVHARHTSAVQSRMCCLHLSQVPRPRRAVVGRLLWPRRGRRHAPSPALTMATSALGLSDDRDFLQAAVKTLRFVIYEDPRRAGRPSAGPPCGRRAAGMWAGAGLPGAGRLTAHPGTPGRKVGQGWRGRVVSIKMFLPGEPLETETPRYFHSFPYLPL